MSRKKKPRSPARALARPPDSAAPSPVTSPAARPGTPAAAPTDAAAVAGTPPRAGHFKESIERFKELLKRERRPEWLDGLAAAYAGRAGQLAAKGMVNEALALWRTRAQACGLPLLDGPYLGWLMQAGQVQQALALLPQLGQLPAEARERARTRLAPALLAAPEALLAGLPEEDRQPCLAARAALAASTGGTGGTSGTSGTSVDSVDSAALDAALQAISFRSPYRDLRPLLKALSLLGSDRAAAAAALARVPADGPFESMAAALRVCLLPRSEWLAGLRALDEAGRALVLEIEGCPPAQRALVLELASRAGERSVDRAVAPFDLLELLLRQRRNLPEAFLRRHTLRLLPQAPQRLDALRAAGLAPTPIDEQRVLALAVELKQGPEGAERHWLRLVELLAKAPGGYPRAALVLRRLAEAHADHAPEGGLCSHAHDWLTRSLRFDPADRATALRLVRAARAEGDLKEARRLLDGARERAPDDIALLLEAVEVALAAGSFKKAAGLAKQVLQADPINPRVRSLIGQAHLSHARKQIGQRKPAAAQRELDEAANWLRSSSERAVLTLLRSLATEPGAAADALLRAAVLELGGQLIGAFQLLLEARRVKHPDSAAPLGLLKRAGVDLTATPGAAELLAFARALQPLPAAEHALHVAVGVLGSLLERAAGTVELSENDHLLVCEALHRHQLGTLTGRYAAAALARWPKRPVFVYFEVAARYAAAPWTLPPREWDRLDLAYEQAQEQGDQRTASRLSRLLGDSGGFGPGGPGDLDDLDDFDDFDGDDVVPSLEQMIEEMGGQARFLEIARQQLGGAVLDKLQRDHKGDPKRMFGALVEELADGLAGGTPGRRGPPPRKKAPAGKKQKDLFDE